MKIRLITYLAVLAALLTACAPTSIPTDTQTQSDTQEQAQAVSPTEESQPAAEEPTQEGTSATREVPDLTNLPIGDDYITTSGPAVGYVWVCRDQTGGGGAESTGDWYDEAAGRWNFELKPVVDGSVSWDSEITITVQGDTRHIVANGLPAEPTGDYPIAASDDAYQYDANPNSISAQDFTLDLTANPTSSGSPNCVRGEVGISIDGVVLNNPVDAVGRDAVATEIQDACQGHPHKGGIYHYHGYSFCLEDQNAQGHSALIGYALDGFGIYGIYGENGEVMHNEDLDECHGHTHSIDWDGQTVEMYHYHATPEFPYLVGCFRADAATFTDAIQANESGQSGEQPGGQSGGQGDGQPGGQGDNPNGGNNREGNGNPPPQGNN
jgi:hypothetical protein